MTTKFVQTIEGIVKAVGQMEKYKTDSEFYLKIVPDCTAFEPLVIEAYDGMATGIGKRNISVAHYYEQNGDLCADPDILMTEDGQPIEITQPLTGYSRIMEKREDGIYCKKALKADVMSFMTSWAGNIRHGVWYEIATTGKGGKVLIKNDEGKTVEFVRPLTA